jgi:sulfide:quinone oxidoreductase
MPDKTVVVLGGGAGGLVTAHHLARTKDGHRIVLVERDPVYHFPPSLLWVLSGARRPEQITVDLRRLTTRRGIELTQADVQAIDVDAGRIETSTGPIPYDRLVVALGAELAPDILPGFTQGAHNVYTLEGAVSAGRALEDLPGGRVVVLVSRLPYKCPAAPYETALLAEALLRKRGVRSGATVDIYTPEPFPMPTAGPVLGEALRGILERRQIGFHPEHTVERIEPETRELVLTSGQRVGYDLLLGVPPHRAPAPARESGLAAETGFIPVDRTTLATTADGVFAIGDVTTIPVAGGKFLPKAGVFAHGHAEVVAKRITAELAGRPPSDAFDGKGACFLEMGDGIAAYATGNFYADDAPQVTLRRPGRHWHLAKVAFEKYWLKRWLLP